MMSTMFGDRGLNRKDATTIPLDDPEVMSLFHSTDILGITPEDIGGIEMGSLGVPEFGTEFVMQMLKDTNPKCFSDLVRISGCPTVQTYGLEMHRH